MESREQAENPTILTFGSKLNKRRSLVNLQAIASYLSIKASSASGFQISNSLNSPRPLRLCSLTIFKTMPKFSQQESSLEFYSMLKAFHSYGQMMHVDRPQELDSTSVIPSISDLLQVQQNGSTERIGFQSSWLRLINKQMSKSRRRDVRSCQDIVEFKVPDMRIERTPGKPLKHIGLPCLLNGYAERLIFDGEDAEIAASMMHLANKHGWLMVYLVACESHWNARWIYWDKTMERGKLLNRPIPEIDWLKKPNSRTMDHLYHCLNLITPDWRKSGSETRKVIRYFFDWLLWSLGHPLVPDFPEDLWGGRSHDKLFQVFDVEWLLAFPYDHFGQLLEQTMHFSLHSMNKSIKLATQLFSSGGAKKKASSFGGFANVDYRSAVLIEPECETGRLLLASSNYCFRAVGCNTDEMLSKVSLLNDYLFRPWSIYPFPFLGSTGDVLDIQGRTLTVMKAKDIDRSYFSRTEVAPNAALFQPIQFRAWKTDSSLSLEKPILPVIGQLSLGGPQLEMGLSIEPLSMANLALDPAPEEGKFLSAETLKLQRSAQTPFLLEDSSNPE